MTGYSEGKHDDPADTQNRLVKIGSKYQATAPAVADGDNVYLLVDSAGRALIAGSVAHDAPDAGNPLKVGGKATTGTPTAVANADRVDAHFDEYGKLGVFIGDDGATTITKVSSLGQLNISPAVPGASEVKQARFQSATNTTTRATMLTPTSGKKVRIIWIHITNLSATVAAPLEVYFGTGADITTNTGKAIMENRAENTNVPNDVAGPFPDGGGPVGAVDDVVSFRTSADIAANGRVIMVYREE